MIIFNQLISFKSKTKSLLKKEKFNKEQEIKWPEIRSFSKLVKDPIENKLKNNGVQSPIK